MRSLILLGLTSLVACSSPAAGEVSSSSGSEIARQVIGEIDCEFLYVQTECGRDGCGSFSAGSTSFGVEETFPAVQETLGDGLPYTAQIHATPSGAGSATGFFNVVLLETSTGRKISSRTTFSVAPLATGGTVLVDDVDQDVPAFDVDGVRYAHINLFCDARGYSQQQ